MNKIFKVVWSQVKGCFVVINEFGKTHQSKSKRIAKKGLYRGVLGACILGIISSSPVFAVTGGNETIKFQDGEGTVVGNATAQGNSNTVAIGKESTAKGGSSVAIGGGKTDGKGASDEDQGTGQGQVAIGWSTAVNGTGVVAIGNSAASGRGAVALGNKSSASEEGSVAIGNHSTALGTNSVAIGGGSANGVGAISIGADSSSTYNGAITLGRNSEATNQDAIALGAGSAVGSVGGFAVSGGYVGTSDYYGIAIGAGASVDGGHNNIGGGIALGKDAKVTAEGSVALGYGSKAGAANQDETAKSWTITIGNDKTTYSFAGYYKQQQYVIGKGVVSVGAKGAERMITNVAAGNLSPESTDVVNGSQLYAVTDAVKKIGKVAGAKTTLTETSDGAITVSKNTEKDGHDNYDITFNADKVAEATSLSYKASGDAASKTVSLSKGLIFAAGTNLTATSGADGVITYDLKNTLTGITSISNGSNGATITLSNDAVTLNNKPLKGVANGTGATDAVNKGQLDSAIEKITGNNGALSNTITLTGDGASSTTGQALNKQGGISFAITGNGDITTTADGSSVNLTLNKATSVAKGETKVVTSGAVYSAVEGSKTAITTTDDAGILTVNKAEGAGIAKDTYTLGINASALNTEVAKNYYNKTEVDTKVTGAKTTLTETSGGAITVSKNTEKDGHDNYDITFNADKVAEATNLSYKASGDAASKTVSLSKGLTFAAGTNLTATSGADGVITYDLKNTLTGITSISNGSNGATITLSNDAVTLNNKPLKGVANGTGATDAVNKGQLDSAIEKITGNNGALSNTITLGGNNGSFTSNQTLNQKDGIKLIIKGVDESSNENGKIVAPEWADFDTNNVMTKADGDTLRIAISKMPTFKTVNTDMIIAKEGSFSDKIVIGNITIQNKGGQLTWDGNNTLFYVEDKDGNKRAIGLNDSVRFNEYLKVVDDEKNISGNGGTGSDNSGVNGSSGALDKNTTPTVNVDVDKLINEKDLANKTYINNKLSELKTTIISEVSPNGTIGTGMNTDMKAVSGQTVEEYLEKNYTNNRELNRYLTELSHQANAGTASALASAGMPQISSLENGNIMISAGVGSYGGESAVALGISGINNNRDITYKVATTYDSTGRWGLSGGIGFAIGAGSNRSLNNVNSKELANRLNSLEKANKSLSETNSKLQEEVENLKAMLQQLLQK